MRLKEELYSRKEYVEKVIDSMDSRASNSRCEGSVYVKSHKKGFQYYEKTDSGITYIKAGNLEYARRVVQNEYNNKVLKAAKEEYKRLTGLLNMYDNNYIEDVYKKMPKGKRVLVKPIRLSDEEYVKMWNEQQYEKLEFREGVPEFYSARGERMRSKSEVMIADLLDRMKINYKYEKPLKLTRLGIVHPDFTLLDVKNRKEIYFEHLGMMDDLAYRNNAFNKIRAYEKDGYFIGDRLIVTTESVNCLLDIKGIEKKVRFYLDI